MAIESLRDAKECVERATAGASRLRAMESRLDSEFLPPAPIPLTLVAFEEWLDAAEAALRRPQIARAQKLLAEVGIDSSSIPAAVLTEVDEVGSLVSDVASLPEGMRARVTALVSHALTKGIEDARSVTVAFGDLAKSLESISDLAESYPSAMALILESVPESTQGHESYIKAALRIRDLLSQAKSLGAQIDGDKLVMDELDKGLSRFDDAYRELVTVLVDEGLSKDDVPDVDGMQVSIATKAFEDAYNAVLDRKKAMEDEYDQLGNRLSSLGVETPPRPKMSSELQDGLVSLKQRMSERHDELASTLGKEAVILVDSLARGTAPSSDALDDAKLGRALRQALAAGFQIKIEAPHED